MPESQSIFVVTYRSPDKKDENISIRVRKVEDSVLGPAFIALSDFIFQRKSALINPQDEYAKKRFQSTKTLHISIYNIISIEEKGEEHPGLQLADRGKLLQFDPNKTKE